MIYDGLLLDMQEELIQFKCNDVWDLILRPYDKTIIGTKWVFRNKLDENGIISNNKARLVVREYSQAEGIDYEETYAPIARLVPIRLLSTFVCCLDFKLYQMNVKLIFLNNYINEEVYVSQPPGFEDLKNLDYVFKLKRVIYGLKQSPRV